MSDVLLFRLQGKRSALDFENDVQTGVVYTFSGELVRTGHSGTIPAFATFSLSSAQSDITIRKRADVCWIEAKLEKSKYDFFCLLMCSEFGTVPLYASMKLSDEGFEFSEWAFSEDSKTFDAEFTSLTRSSELDEFFGFT